MQPSRAAPQRIRRIVAGAALGGLLLSALACVSIPYTDPPKPRAHPYHPGDSLEATELCKCRACDPRACCDGDDFTEQAEAGCADDPASCPMVVRSCSSRCFEHAWRVPTGQACNAKLPARCCG